MHGDSSLKDCEEDFTMFAFNGSKPMSEWQVRVVA